MTTQLESTDPTTSLVVAYPITVEEIRAACAKYTDLKFDTPADYLIGVKAIAHLRETRVAVEARRKELKAESLERGRKIDAVAKELTALLESFEEPLKARRQLVDDGKERAKAAKEAAERAKVEEEIRLAREAEESR